MPYYPPDTVQYQFVASDRGYLAETAPAHYMINTVTPGTAGRLEFMKIKLPKPSSVTNIVMFVTTAGNTLTAGQNFAALYTHAGALLAQTADQAAAWVSTGVKTMALAGGAQALAAGFYYVAIWYNGTTSPTWPRTSNTAALLTNAGFAAPSLLAGTADTGLTTTAPATMAAQTANSNHLWAALS